MKQLKIKQYIYQAKCLSVAGQDFDIIEYFNHKEDAEKWVLEKSKILDSNEFSYIINSIEVN